MFREVRLSQNSDDGIQRFQHRLSIIACDCLVEGLLDIIQTPVSLGGFLVESMCPRLVFMRQFGKPRCCQSFQLFLFCAEFLDCPVL